MKNQLTTAGSNGWTRRKIKTIVLIAKVAEVGIASPGSYTVGICVAYYKQ